MASITFFLGFLFLPPLQEEIDPAETVLKKESPSESLSTDGSSSVKRKIYNEQSIINGKTITYYNLFCAPEPLYIDSNGVIAKRANM